MPAKEPVFKVNNNNDNKIKSRKWIRLRKVFASVGPGLVAGASDDDPSGIASFSEAGAGFGLSTLWMPVVIFPLMTSIQQMCARIGLVTKEGLTGNVNKHYPRIFSYLLVLIVLPALILNLGADLQGMGAVAHLLIHSVPDWVFTIAFTLLLIFLIIKLPYKKIVTILKWLCLSLFLYAIVPFMVKTDVGLILKSIFMPRFELDKEFITIVVAVLGAGISPYMFFWQVSIEVEESQSGTTNKNINRREKSLKLDVNLGIFVSCLIMFFIILTTGTVLHQAGVYEIQTVNQAAKALEPLAGKFSYFLFAAGIIGTGLLAIPSLVGSFSFIIAETFKLKKGLNKTFTEAPGFYLTMILSLLLGLSLDFFGINPVQALIYSATLYGLIAPLLIMLILHMSNNKRIMGSHVNSQWLNIRGFITLLVTISAALLLVYIQIMG